MQNYIALDLYIVNMHVTLYLYIVNMHVTLLQRTSFAEFNENKLYKLDVNKLEKTSF